MKLLQINVTANWGSHGKIAENIGKLAIKEGWESWIAYGRGTPTSESHLIRIGNARDMKMHGVETRLFDNHGLASKGVTKRFIEQVKELKPDLIHLHNIHGYYINYPELFRFLKEYGAPVVWTLHDCWSMTGHCAHFEYVKCNRWQTECHDCPQKKIYPTSLFADRSRRNHEQKKASFLGCPNLTFVPVSDWLDRQLKQSFLSSYPTMVIQNGIDISVFKPSDVEKNGEGKIILGVASVWGQRKGLEDFIKLRELLPEEYQIILVGLNQKQIAGLPQGIKGISRTENVGQLIDLYSMADVFVNPTLEDSFPTVNLEALACGTPIVTYRTGGSPEAIDEKTGIVVEKGNVSGLAKAIKKVVDNPALYTSEYCRERAVEHFNQDICFRKYIELYQKLIDKANRNKMR